MESPPVALAISGSDCSAGAGAQADLKAFSVLGCYGLSALTCVVAEVPGRVISIHGVPVEILSEQIRLLFDAFPIRAVKTGMLLSADRISAVARALRHRKERQRGLPIVVDPVMVATSGDSLLEDGSLTAYQAELFPLADLVTPNMDEARVLAGRELRSVADLEIAAREFQRRWGGAWLVKGGHLGGERAVDVLFDGSTLSHFESAFIEGVQTHGTGCTLSAAITACLAKGIALSDAVEIGKKYVTRAIEQHLTWEGVHALHHFAGCSLTEASR